MDEVGEAVVGGGIGWAVGAMTLQGRRVCRRGWNGKGMFLVHVPSVVHPSGLVMQEFVAMKTVQGTLVPWLCSQTDLLATDWEEYAEPL